MEIGIRALYTGICYSWHDARIGSRNDIPAVIINCSNGDIYYFNLHSGIWIYYEAKDKFILPAVYTENESLND